MTCKICGKKVCRCAAKWDDGELVRTDRGIITLNDKLADLDTRAAILLGRVYENGDAIKRENARLDDLNSLANDELEALKGIVEAAETKLLSVPMGEAINFEEITGHAN
jgi:hypothetical protein